MSLEPNGATVKDQARTAHFRIVMPKGLKGTMHLARGAQVYVTIPGLPEFKFPALVDVDAHWAVDGATELTLKCIGSIVVEYPDE